MLWKWERCKTGQLLIKLREKTPKCTNVSLLTGFSDLRCACISNFMERKLCVLYQQYLHHICCGDHLWMRYNPISDMELYIIFHWTNIRKLEVSTKCPKYWAYLAWYFMFGIHFIMQTMLNNAENVFVWKPVNKLASTPWVHQVHISFHNPYLKYTCWL